MRLIRTSVRAAQLEGSTDEAPAVALTRWRPSAALAPLVTVVWYRERHHTAGTCITALGLLIYIYMSTR